MFSSRLPADLSRNRLTQALDALRAQGQPIINLTESNPTRAGFTYPADLLAPLADARGLAYAPEPLGLLEARRAVSADYSRQGFDVSPGHLALTASTSEAYGFLFKLLADAGDEVLVPRPSYPLFDHLTRLDLVESRPYELEYHDSWSIDFASVERALTKRTRAILVVSPNNPTGSFLKPDELDRLAALCADREIPLIADEVFRDYALIDGATDRAACVLDQHDALVFSLGGLSKSIGLPQAKLGWIAVAGPDARVTAALERLEMVGDTYLSVSTPMQLAAARLLDRGGVIRHQIGDRVRHNYEWLRARVARVPACRVLHAEGGWYAVVQMPSLQPEEDLVLDLLQRDHVLVHPGYFFDFPRETYLIVSLIVSESLFVEGIDRIVRRHE